VSEVSSAFTGHSWRRRYSTILIWATKKAGRTPGQINNLLPKELTVILTDSKPERTGLVLIFRVDEPEQAEALHTFRAAFGAATDLEAVTETVFALHIRPGVCSCGKEAA
jgi:hypothetical protein